MSSLQGTNTEFSSIAGNFLYLTLNPDDREYLTNIEQKTFSYMGVDEPDRLSQEQKMQYLKKVLEAQNTFATLELYRGSDGNRSILDTLKAINLDNYLSGVIADIINTDFESELKARRKGNVDGITFFAYANGSEGMINNWINQWRPDYWNQDNSLKYKREILKHHTLNFRLFPQQIQNKRLQVATQLSDYISVYNKIDIETLDDKLYVNYSASNYLLDGEGYYPTSLQRIKILQAINCTDGIVYVIERPILPIIF